MKTVAVSLSVYIVGLLVFYSWGQLNNGWYECYYFWDKGKDLFLFISLLLVVDKRYKWAVIPVVLFSIIRLTWQIISTVTGWNINNVQVVGWLFIVLALLCSFMTLKEVLKWRK